jgi:hypothetical protein
MKKKEKLNKPIKQKKERVPMCNKLKRFCKFIVWYYNIVRDDE